MAQQIFTRLTAALVMLFVGSVIVCAQVSESRPAIPTREQQQAILTQLEETQGLSKAKTKAEKEQVVAKLMELVDQSSESPDELYVLLDTVIPLIRETGDFAAHQIAVQKLTETFSIEPLPDQTQQLLLFITACKSKESLTPAVEELAGLAHDEGQANQFDKPLEWLAAADKVAKKLNDKPSVARIADTKLQLTQRQTAFAAYETAKQTLATDPADPKANFAKGQWLAVFANDWNAALPLLAQGADPLWQAAATAELAADESVESQLKVADAWYKVAETTGPAQPAVRQRVLDLYTQVEPAVTKPITKGVVKKRIDELTASLTTAAPVSRKLVPKPKPKKDENELPVGEPIDLLAMVKLPEHAVMGNWKRVGDEVVCEPGPASRCIVPVSVIGSYGLTVNFTRHSNNEAIDIRLPIGETTCEFVLDGWGGQVHGLHLINNKMAIDNIGSGGIRSRGPVTNETAHRLDLDVKPENGNVLIDASLDGIRIYSWSGSLAHLSQWAGSAMPIGNCLAIRAHESKVTFHSFTLRLNKGGRGYRLGDDWKNSLFPVDTKPSKEVAKAFPLRDWNGKKYLISDKPMPLPDVQRWATQVKGRLLTISSKEEQEFIVSTTMGSRHYWTSGWCAVDRKWRDERNRPLRFIDHLEQNNAWGREPWIVAIPNGGLQDYPPDHNWPHACIEWGEEYPDGP